MGAHYSPSRARSRPARISNGGNVARRLGAPGLASILHPFDVSTSRRNGKSTGGRGQRKEGGGDIPRGDYGILFCTCEWKKVGWWREGVVFKS